MDAVVVRAQSEAGGMGRGALSDRLDSFFTADNIRFSADRQATEAAEAASSGSRTARPAESSRPSTATNAVTASAIAIANTLDPVAATQSTKNSLVAGVLLTAGLVLPFFVVAWPTRMVTRLTQVRLVPATASATTAGAAKHAPREYIEVETISQAMWRGPWGRPRLIPREDVHVARIWQGRDLSDTPYLKLALTPTAPEHRSILDKWSYRINFMPVRETDYTVPLRDGSLPEVVVSLKRMEEVFGRLRA